MLRKELRICLRATEKMTMRTGSALLRNAMPQRTSYGRLVPCHPMLTQTRSFGFWEEFRKRFNKELEKNPDMEQSLKSLKKTAEMVKESREKVSQSVSKVGETVSSIKKSIVDEPTQKIGAVGEQVAETTKKLTEKLSEKVSQSEAVQGVSRASDALRQKLGQSAVGSALSFVKQEVSNIEELFPKKKAPEKLDPRVRYNVFNDARLKRLDDLAKGIAQPLPSVATNENVEESDSSANPVDESEPVEEVTQTSVVVIKTPQTVWGQRLSSLKERMEQWRVVQSLERVKTAVRQNPVSAATRNAKIRMQEKVADIQEEMENTQNPVFYKAKDLLDKVGSETEQGYAMGELLKIDPHFTRRDFLIEVRFYIVPVVVQAFLRGDLEAVEMLCEGQALAQMKVAFKQRQIMGLALDDRILAIRYLSLANVTVVNNDPVLVIHTQLQHINLVKDRAGKIIEGSETHFSTVFYTMALKRRFDSKDFDYSIVEISMQKVNFLT